MNVIPKLAVTLAAVHGFALAAAAADHLPAYDLAAIPDGSVRAVVRSYESAAIASELNARITHIPAREGDRFKKGDLLVAFDCGKIDAEYDAGVANFKMHRAQYENQKHLHTYKAAGSLTVEQAQFEADRAAAEVRGLEAKRSGCRIVAPFDGRVTEKTAQMHELAQPNQPLLKIVNEVKIELVLMVPSSWLARVSDGTKFAVKFDETGETFEARIVQSTGFIDPVSQSVRLVAEISDAHAAVLPGMSGTAVFNLHEARN